MPSALRIAGAGAWPLRRQVREPKSSEKSPARKQGPTHGALLPIRSAHADDPTASVGNRCHVSSSEGQHERQMHRALTGGISKHPYNEVRKSAFVRALPVRSTTNTTFKARRSIEKLLHAIFRAAFIVLSSTAAFHRRKSSRLSSALQRPGSGYELILSSLQRWSSHRHSLVPWMSPR